MESSERHTEIPPLTPEEVLNFRINKFKKILPIYLDCYKRILNIFNQKNLEFKDGLIKELNCLIEWEKNNYEELQKLNNDESWYKKLDRDGFNQNFTNVKEFFSKLSKIFDEVVNGKFTNSEQSFFNNFVKLMRNLNDLFIELFAKNDNDEKGGYVLIEYLYENDKFLQTLQTNNETKKHMIFWKDILMLYIHVYSSLLNYISKELKNLLDESSRFKYIKLKRDFYSDRELSIKYNNNYEDFCDFMWILGIKSYEDLCNKYNILKEIQSEVNNLKQYVSNYFNIGWDFDYSKMKNLRALLDTSSGRYRIITLFNQLRNLLTSKSQEEY